MSWLIECETVSFGCRPRKSASALCQRHDQKTRGDEAGSQHYFVDVAMLRPGASFSIVPPQNPIQRTIVDVSALGVKLAYPDA
jgi:hypothetical protein